MRALFCRCSLNLKVFHVYIWYFIPILMLGLYSFLLAATIQTVLLLKSIMFGFDIFGLIHIHSLYLKVFPLLFLEYIIKNVRYGPFYINYLFIEFTENVPSCDMHHYWDMKWPISGYEILVISHSPRVRLRWERAGLWSEMAVSVSLCLLRSLSDVCCLGWFQCYKSPGGVCLKLKLHDQSWKWSQRALLNSDPNKDTHQNPTVHPAEKPSVCPSLVTSHL